MLGVGPESVQSSATSHSPFEYVKNLRRRLNSFNRIAKSNSDRSKEEARRRYDLSNGSEDWVPFQVGDTVKYKNHYPDRSNRKFSQRFRGPYEVRDRRGVNYKVDCGNGRSRWVHHDELLPWRSRSQVQSSPATNGCRAGEGSGAEPEQRATFVGDEDAKCESDSISDEGGDAVSDAVCSEVRVSQRPPAWMRA